MDNLITEDAVYEHIENILKKQQIKGVSVDHYENKQGSEVTFQFQLLVFNYEVENYKEVINNSGLLCFIEEIEKHENYYTTHNDCEIYYDSNQVSENFSILDIDVVMTFIK